MKDGLPRDIINNAAYRVFKDDLSEMFSVMNFGEFGSNEKVKTELKKTIIYGLKFKNNDEI